MAANDTPAPGPYATREQAAADVADIYEVMGRLPRRGAGRPESIERMTEACRAAGVEVGAYDGEILSWLSRWEPETCQVIAALILRAHQSGRGMA